MRVLFKTIAYSLVLLMSLSCAKQAEVYNLEDFGVIPDTGEDSSPLLKKALAQISEEARTNGKITINLLPGRYDFHSSQAFEKEYYISNHDQTNPKMTAFAFEGMENMIFDGHGAELIFHGRMLPMALVESENILLKDFSIDFENPHITQISVVENHGKGGISFKPAPWVKYELRDGDFTAFGEGWKHCPYVAMAFEPDTRHILYRTSDVEVNMKGVIALEDSVFLSKNWRDERLVPGTILTLRTYDRPAPGIFIACSKNVTLENIRIHYAEGMGLLAQTTENITLDGFSVCLKGDDDPRYFTTQADATHFSGCKGKIESRNGVYENMMDDAINVHGTYLKIVGIENNSTVIGQYMHPQTYGFFWGEKGDTIQFIASKTMEICGNENIISSIEPYGKETIAGATQFKIEFTSPVPEAVKSGENFGIENLSWTPEVVFEDNVVRNNRARGALFSTPKKVMVENNLFDHTSGTAILLCGDCNGWYETGACKDVTIRHNYFINALTNMFQFTNAVISIYPEIPDLDGQKECFHSGIVIEDNEFETFDNPILYAKSTKNLTFRDNTIRKNNDYPAFHWNKQTYLLERCENTTIENNSIIQ